VCHTRAGAKFTGGYGTKTGEADLLFLEGQLPTVDGVVDTDQSAAEQMERCLVNLRTALNAHNRTLDDVLKVTGYLTTPGQYESVNEVYRDAFDERLPARAVVGVSELLGGAAIQLEAVAAIE
jgi:2-iminobutanoate/2-iminopropanoate deaminase